MKVLFLLDSLGAGGAERSTALLLPFLVDRGVEVGVVVLRHEDKGSEAEVRSLGIDVQIIDAHGLRSRAQEVRRHVRRSRPDILHTAIYAADQVGRLASAGLETKVISSLVNVPRLRRFRSAADPVAWKTDLVNLFDAATGRLFVDRFHAVTPGVASMYSKAYRISPSRISVVERGRSADDLGFRSLERTQRVRESLGISTETRVVVAAGRHEFQKAHVDLVKAIAIVGSDRADVVLLIAGRDGNATAQLEREIDQTPGAERFVRLLGHRSDVADLLAASDVMALPSIFEGTAGIALEAMGVGTPIVSTRLDGMAGILEHERNALVVEPGAPAAMAIAIERLLGDTGLGVRLAAAGRVDFVERFTLERSADRMVELYRDVIGEHAQGPSPRA